MGTRGSFLGVKRTWHEADLSPLSRAEVKEWMELHIHSPNTPSWRGAQWKKKAQGQRHLNFYLSERKQDGTIAILGMLYQLLNILSFELLLLIPKTTPWSRVLQNLINAQEVKEFPPAIGPYPEPLLPPQSIILIYAWTSQTIRSLQVIWPNIHTHFSSPSIHATCPTHLNGYASNM
jgi:hypothetical protein